LKAVKFIDLFCGIGGFHQATHLVESSRDVKFQCVFASDIDPACQRTYQHNYGVPVVGDIKAVQSEEIPAHDILFAGFPCQPFSIIGEMRGFEDTRGTLFFEIARILSHHRPKAFVLENVKMLVGHRNGETLGRIMETLRDLGYRASFRVLNALDFGVPQKRERVFIVGFLEPCSFLWPLGGIEMKPLSAILEPEVDAKYFASDLIQQKRREHHQKDQEPSIWHENKSGNISKYPFSCALRAGASYNYLLVDGERRLTEREMLRLQGFPDSFEITEPYGTVRHQAGNSVAVPVVAAVLDRVLDALGRPSVYPVSHSGQFEMVMETRVGP
jgi:DNA (cytosine-5)-methyltransferase 1